ncbi:MAG: very short patch repair endonuclease [Bacteroidales bacterium]|nr:very short patch repair endonuclease [Bacteroidales bacterium]
MDNLTKKQRRKNMQAIRSKDTKIEILLGKILWTKGLRYRKNDKTVFGKPDFTFKRHKLAVFCDSEFWHGKNWKHTNKKIKSNRRYWIKKIERNIQRDKEVKKQLKKDGWKVIRFWAKQIEKDSEKCVLKILAATKLVN